MCVSLQDIGVWREKYQLLGETVSFLIATTEDPIACQLKEKYRFISNKWDYIFSVRIGFICYCFILSIITVIKSSHVCLLHLQNTKQYMQAGEMLRHRKEYRLSIEKLQSWLREAESILDSPNLSSTVHIKNHIQQLMVSWRLFMNLL